LFVAFIQASCSLYILGSILTFLSVPFKQFSFVSSGILMVKERLVSVFSFQHNLGLACCRFSFLFPSLFLFLCDAFPSQSPPLTFFWPFVHPLSFHLYSLTHSVITQYVGVYSFLSFYLRFISSRVAYFAVVSV